MSKVIPIALAAHMALGSTTLAHALKITRSDSQVFAFTSGVDDVTLSGVLHVSAPGLKVSEIVTSAGLAVDNLELTTLDDGSTFTRADVLGGKWRNAAFVISRFNYNAPADGVEVLITGTLGEVYLQRGMVVVELRGLQQWLQQTVGNVSSKTCRARLGDSLCTVALGPYTTPGEVSSVTSNQVFVGTDTSVPGDPNYASVGLLLHFDGANTSTTFTDTSPTPKTVTAVGNAQISTAVTLVAAQAGLFDGSGDYLTVPYSADFDFPGNFKIEFTVRLTAYSAAYSGNYGAAIVSRYLSGGANGGWQVRINGTASAYNTLNIYTGVTDLNITGLSFALNTTYQVEVSRVSGVIRAFVNGVQVGSNIANTDNFTRSTSSPLYIGALNDAGFRFYLNGRLDELRITKAGGHTANFTPEVVAFPDFASVPPPAEDWFGEGSLSWVTGANTGLSQKIKAYTVAGQFTLSLPMLQTVVPGDTYTVVAGCRKRLSEDCVTKFDNVLNFQGEPHLPGIDQLTRSP